MGSMRTSPAGLLLLALALIAAVQLMKVNAARIALETTTTSTTSGSTTVDSTTGSTTASSAGSSSAGSSSGESELPITTTVEVGGARLSFSKKRCVSVPKKAARGRSLQVWWKGRGGSSYGGSSYGYASNVDSGSTGGGKAGGVSCSQVKLFGKGGCQGKEVDCLVNSNSTAVMSPSTKKKLPQGASVASVLCAVPEQPKEEPQPKEDTPQQPQPKEDPACAALGCEPVGGKCEVDGNGERYCKWDSPCGSCPTGATCKTVPATSNSGVPVQLPYCACPDGYGMTETSCVEGGKSTVASTSITLVAEWKAKDNTSRPYTLRWNLNGCTQYPAAVAGNYSSEYLLANINSTADCRVAYQYYTDNCEGPPNHVIYLNDDPYYPSVMVGMIIPQLTRSAKCG